MKDKTDLKTLDQFIEEQYGPKGTVNRDKFEKGYKSFEKEFLTRKKQLKRFL